MGNSTVTHGCRRHGRKNPESHPCRQVADSPSDMPHAGSQEHRVVKYSFVTARSDIVQACESGRALQSLKDSVEPSQMQPEYHGQPTAHPHSWRIKANTSASTPKACFSAWLCGRPSLCIAPRIQFHAALPAFAAASACLTYASRSCSAVPAFE